MKGRLGISMCKPKHLFISLGVQYDELDELIKIAYCPTWVYNVNIPSKFVYPIILFNNMRFATSIKQIIILME